MDATIIIIIIVTTNLSDLDWNGILHQKEP